MILSHSVQPGHRASGPLNPVLAACQNAAPGKVSRARAVGRRRCVKCFAKRIPQVNSPAIPVAAAPDSSVSFHVLDESARRQQQHQQVSLQRQSVKALESKQQSGQPPAQPVVAVVDDPRILQSAMQQQAVGLAGAGAGVGAGRGAVLMQRLQALPMASATKLAGLGQRFGFQGAGIVMGMALAFALQMLARWMRLHVWIRQLASMLDIRRASGRHASTSAAAADAATASLGAAAPASRFPGSSYGGGLDNGRGGGPPGGYPSALAQASSYSSRGGYPPPPRASINTMQPPVYKGPTNPGASAGYPGYAGYPGQPVQRGGFSSSPMTAADPAATAGGALASTGAAAGSSTDTGESVEWINMVIRKVWRVYQRGLERWIVELLQPVFDTITSDGSVPRFLQGLRIVELTLDHDAPTFSNMRRRTSRKDYELTGVVDVRYTGGARMLLMLELGEGKWKFKVPVLVSDLDLECQLWIKIRLAPMCPWVGTISVAFSGAPNVKVQLSPYNRVRLMRVPVVQNFLRKLLTVDLPAVMVLPERLEIPIPPSVTSVAEAAVGRDTIMRAVASAVLQADALEPALLSALPLGPQTPAGGVTLPELFKGELTVALKEARGLPVWGFPGQSNPYCRLTLGEQAMISRREGDTSKSGRHRAPVWNQETQFLVEDPNKQVLEIVVKDSHLTGRTEVGRARFALADLPPDGHATVWLALEQRDGNQSGRNEGEILIDVSYKSFEDEEEPSPETAAGDRMAEALALALEPSDAKITDIRSAAAASSRAAVAAFAAISAIAMTKAAAARAAARAAKAAQSAAAAAASAVAEAASGGRAAADRVVSAAGRSLPFGGSGGGSGSAAGSNGKASNAVPLPPPSLSASISSAAAKAGGVDVEVVGTPLITGDVDSRGALNASAATAVVMNNGVISNIVPVGPKRATTPPLTSAGNGVGVPSIATPGTSSSSSTAPAHRPLLENSGSLGDDLLVKNDGELNGVGGDGSVSNGLKSSRNGSGSISSSSDGSSPPPARRLQTSAQLQQQAEADAMRRGGLPVTKVDQVNGQPPSLQELARNGQGSSRSADSALRSFSGAGAAGSSSGALASGGGGSGGSSGNSVGAAVDPALWDSASYATPITSKPEPDGPAEAAAAAAAAGTFAASSTPSGISRRTLTPSNSRQLAATAAAAPAVQSRPLRPPRSPPIGVDPLDPRTPDQHSSSSSEDAPLPPFIVPSAVSDPRALEVEKQIVASALTPAWGDEQATSLLRSDGSGRVPHSAEVERVLDLGASDNEDSNVRSAVAALDPATAVATAPATAGDNKYTEMLHRSLRLLGWRQHNDVNGGSVLPPSSADSGPTLPVTPAQRERERQLQRAINNSRQSSNSSGVLNNGPDVIDPASGSSRPGLDAFGRVSGSNFASSSSSSTPPGPSQADGGWGGFQVPQFRWPWEGPADSSTSATSAGQAGGDPLTSAIAPLDPAASSAAAKAKDKDGKERHWWQFWVGDGSGVTDSGRSIDVDATTGQSRPWLDSASAGPPPDRSTPVPSTSIKPWWQFWDDKDKEAPRGSSAAVVNGIEGGVQPALRPPGELDLPVQDVVIPPDLPLEEIALEVARLKEESWRSKETAMPDLWRSAGLPRNDSAWGKLVAFLLTLAVALLALVAYRLGHLG